MRRLAFVGQPAYFSYTSLQHPTGGVEPRFFSWRPDGDASLLLAALRAWAPDIVFCWRPELIPAGLFGELPNALTVGYLTEPLPRPDGASHHDLELRLEHLRAADPGNFDRIVTFNPEIVPAAESAGLRVWRSFPIPVTDAHFSDVTVAHGPPKLIFTGRSTPHREAYLGPVKHDFDVVHLAHGISDDALIAFLRAAQIGINLHNEDYPQYENRVSTFLAAGLLVLTEPLSPRHGLLPGVDLVEVRSPSELWEVVTRIAGTPDAFGAVRRNGRRAAERFRASTVFPRFCAELEADVACFGKRRGATVPRS